MTRVVEQARALPDVLDAKGGWVANITTYGQTGLSATVPAGTPPARADVLAEELMTLMWRSRIDPINDMGATVTVPGAVPGEPPLAVRFAQTSEEFGRLAEKLGPRPTR